MPAKNRNSGAVPTSDTRLRVNSSGTRMQSTVRPKTTMIRVPSFCTAVRLWGMAASVPAPEPNRSRSHSMLKKNGLLSVGGVMLMEKRRVKPARSCPDASWAKVASSACSGVTSNPNCIREATPCSSSKSALVNGVLLTRSVTAPSGPVR